MEDEQILKKTIKKVIKNGFNFITFVKPLMKKNPYLRPDRLIQIVDRSYYSLIFSHKFAEKFWGEEYPKKMNIISTLPYWKLELTQLVMYKNPLKYLEKFL